MIPSEKSPLQDEIIREMPTWKRLRIAFELNEFARKLIRARLRTLYPDIPEEEVERLLTQHFGK